MTLDETIKHAEEVAEEKDNEAQELEYSKLDWKHEASQCLKCATEHRQLAEWLKDYKRLKEQEPCTDAISRQAVVKAIDKHTIDTKEGLCLDDDITCILEELPPVTPQPKMGRWIVNEWGNISCSECGCTALYDKVYPGESVFGKAIRVKSTFCPTCGVKMQEVEE